MIKVFKDFNKMISILVILVMMVSITPVFAVDSETPTLVVSSEKVYQGGTAQIKITLDNIDSIAGISFHLKYDKDKYNEVSKTDITINPELVDSFGVEANPVIGKGEISLLGGKGSNVAISNPIRIMTLTLTSKANAPAGEYDITLTDVRIGIKVDGVAAPVDVDTANGTLTIQQRYSGPSSTTTPNTPKPTSTVKPDAKPSVAKVDFNATVANGKATATVSETAAKKAIEDAVKTAKEGNTTSEVQFNVGSTANIDAADITMKANTIALLKSGAVDYVTISSSIVTVTFDKKAIAVIAESSNNDETLSVIKVDNSTLSAENQKIIGDRPVYDFNLVSNDKKINDFKDGLAKITIPYSLKTGEKAEDLVVYSIKDDGTLEEINNVKYDTSLKAVVFSINYFSKFAIAFETPKVTFTDVSGWPEEFVYFLADRGIVQGKAAGIFAPEDSVTRAEFVAIIARAVGMSNDQTTDTNFKDVKATDWFAPYVAWASQKAIVSGYEDGTFAPDKQITREELCTMIIRTLTAFDKAPAKAELSFADANITSDWAKESVAALAKAGIVSGKGNNMFAPKDSATRAETAKIIYGMYQLLNPTN